MPWIRDADSSYARNTVPQTFGCTEHTRHRYFMMFHIHASLLQRDWDSRHYYCMIVNYWYTDTLVHWIPSCAQLLHVLTSLLYRLTGIYALIVFVFLLHGSWIYSCCIDHCLYDCYMHMHVFSLHEYCLLLIWIFPLLDTWAVDMRYVESHIYCFPFPVIVFRAINRAHVLLSCYMYPVLFLFLILCVH